MSYANKLQFAGFTGINRQKAKHSYCSDSNECVFLPVRVRLQTTITPTTEIQAMTIKVISIGVIYLFFCV